MPSESLILRYYFLLRGLLPKGVFWSNPGPKFRGLLEAFAEMFARWHERKMKLILEMNPATSEELLSEYEMMALNSDEFLTEGSPLSVRQSTVANKINWSCPGPTNAWLTTYVENLGMTDFSFEYGNDHMEATAGWARAGDQLDLLIGIHYWKVIHNGENPNRFRMKDSLLRLKQSHVVIEFDPEISVEGTVVELEDLPDSLSTYEEAVSGDLTVMEDII